jgi:hypothetical protein
LPAAHALQRLEQRRARDNVEGEEHVLHRDELITELAHLVERAIENAAEPRGRLRLTAARDRGQLTKAGFRLCTKLAGAVAGAVHECPRQLLVEEGDDEMVGSELRVAGPPRELLCGSDGLLRFQRELLKVHVLRVGAG